jgi:hypothetical protein
MDIHLKLEAFRVAKQHDSSDLGITQVQMVMKHTSLVADILVSGDTHTHTRVCVNIYIGI